MILLLSNVFVSIALFIVDINYLPSFEFAFLCSFLIIYLSLKSAHHRVMILSHSLRNDEDSNDCKEDDKEENKVPFKNRFFLGARISFGLYRLLSYCLLVIGVISLINNDLFFLVPFLLGTGTCVVAMCINWCKKI